MSAIVQRKLEHARRRMDEGDVAGAVALCNEVLSQAPRNPEALWLLGMARVMNGDPQAAIEPLEQAVASAPNHGMLLDGVGLAYLMVGRYEDAERALRKAASAPGAPAIVHMRLGMALTNLGRHDEAATELQHVISQEPQNIEARVNLGLTYARAADVESAEREFSRVLREVPEHPHALYNLGVITLERDAPAEAESFFRRSLAASPDYVDARVNLGVALQRQERFDEAAVELSRAVTAHPTNVSALNALAQVLAQQGQHTEARARYLRALQCDATSLAAREGLALSSIALGRFGEATTHLRELVRHEPLNAGAWNALGEALFAEGALEEANVAVQHARQLDPSQPSVYATHAQISYVRGELDRASDVLREGYERTRANHLLGMWAHLLRRLCDWPNWQKAWEAMRAQLDQADDLGSPYWLLFEDVSPKEHFEYSRRWARARFGSTAKPPSAHVNTTERSSNATGSMSDRVRIGYLSADFHEHPVARLIVEVLELHDRARFEVFAYSHGPDDGSALRARIEHAVEHFIDIAREPDDRAIELVRSHKLDLLIDLRAYTMGDRLQIMAARPAPVQATWLGYPGGTGAAFIDHLIADEYVVPTGSEIHYSENVLRMPHCYQPNDRQRAIGEPLSRDEYGLPPQGFVFCCFNQTVKYTPEVFSCWLHLLARVPHSILWLLEDNPTATQNLTAAANAAGIASERLVFAPRLAMPQHLARYRVADVALDTFPYGSHTTGSDALWVGCPLVTLRGETLASRVGSSLVTNCGVPELIATTLDDYETLAYRLATDDTFMNEIRGKVASAHDLAPLFDALQFARDLEALYAKIV